MGPSCCCCWAALDLPLPTFHSYLSGSSEPPAAHHLPGLLHLVSPLTTTSKLGSCHLAQLQSPLNFIRLLHPESVGLGFIYLLLLLGPQLPPCYVGPSLLFLTFQRVMRSGFHSLAMQTSSLQLGPWLLVHLMHLLGIHNTQLCIRAGAGVSVGPPP